MQGASPDSIAIVLFVLQGVWGLFLIILTWAMRRVLHDIEENTKATSRVAESVAGINVLLAGNFVTRTDHDRVLAWQRETDAKLIALTVRDEYREQLRKEDADRGGRR